ncbi:hypothetical protein KEM55_009311 [Ascosphaera atra]|nr:hypothetical protein KEM55_009311 [Ascosphaera atra]
MFQRLKDAIDSRIAEEQARQSSASSSTAAPGASSGAGLSRSQSARLPKRTVSQGSLQSTSSQRTARRRAAAAGNDDQAATVLPPQRGPDPTEFDEFVVGEEDGPNGDNGDNAPGTPKIKAADAQGKEGGKGAGNTEKSAADANANATRTELPTDIRVKLRRLEKLETRYQGECSA